MSDTQPNLADPEFEPTDEQLAKLWRDALCQVRARRAAADGDPAGIAPNAPETFDGRHGRG